MLWLSANHYFHHSLIESVRSLLLTIRYIQLDEDSYMKKRHFQWSHFFDDSMCQGPFLPILRTRRNSPFINFNPMMLNWSVPLMKKFALNNHFSAIYAILGRKSDNPIHSRVFSELPLLAMSSKNNPHIDWPDCKTARTGQNEWFILNYQLQNWWITWSLWYTSSIQFWNIYNFGWLKPHIL